VHAYAEGGVFWIRIGTSTKNACAGFGLQAPDCVIEEAFTI
jgi:hypothetical protein